MNGRDGQPNCLNREASMQNRRPRGVILIKRNEERIRPAAFFAFLMVVCMPFHTLTIAGIGLLLLIGIPLLIFCSPVLADDLSRKMWDKAAVLLALFFIFGVAAYVWSPDFTFYSLYNYFKKIMVVLCLYCLPLNGREQKLLLGGSVIACAIVGYFFLTGRNVIDFEGRALLAVFGVEQDPNYLGYLFLMPLAVAMYQCLNGKTLVNKVMGLAFSLLILYCILLTGSRGAFLGLATVVAVNVVSKFKTLGGKIAFCTAMALLVLVLFNYILLLLPEDIAVRFTIQDVVETRGTRRLDIWIATLQAIGNEPYKLLFGFGTGSSIPTLGFATHNFILQLLLETGLVGTVLFLEFLWIWFKRLIRRDTMCLSVMLACMMMSMTLSVNTIYYFWVALTMSIVCSKVRLPEETREKNL